MEPNFDGKVKKDDGFLAASILIAAIVIVLGVGIYVWRRNKQAAALFGSGDRYSMSEILSCRLFLHVAIYFKVGTKAHLLHRQKEKCILLRRIIRTLHMRT